jgi:hypothetical protein
MRTEIITLSLNEVSRQYCSTIAVVVGYRREGRNRDTVLHSVGNHVTHACWYSSAIFLKYGARSRLAIPAFSA